MNIMREIPVGKIRQPAVAGAFYPAQAVPLRQMVETYLKNGITVSQDFPKAIVAPHAGYQFSGPIAGSAFKPWQQAGEKIRRVVLIGPSHFVGFEGLALSPALAWQTPLGVVPVDAEGMEIAAGGAGAKFLASAHAREHCRGHFVQYRTNAHIQLIELEPERNFAQIPIRIVREP